MQKPIDFSTQIYSFPWVTPESDCPNPEKSFVLSLVCKIFFDPNSYMLYFSFSDFTTYSKYKLP